MERIAKKLKLFLDTSQKYKHRYGALQTFLESSAEEDIQQAYKNYSDLMIGFVIESHSQTLERLGMDKDYQGKFERSLGRDLDEHYKVPMLFNKLFKYLRSELVASSQVDQLINIIRTLLHPKNHPALRKEGCGLLMAWLRDPASIHPEVDVLFASTINLSDFVEEGENVYLNQIAFPLIPQGSEPAMVPAPVTISGKEQSLTIFNEVLSYITYDANADKRSTLHLFSLLRKHYLCRLYPDVFSQGQCSNERPMEGFVQGCPEPVQAMLMKYFAIWLVQSPEFQNGGLIPVASFILQEILLSGSVEDLQLVHEILRQSMLLPFAYKPIIKVAVNILRTWIFTAKERRPLFLQSPAESNPIVALMAETIGLGDAELLFDHQIKKYIDMIALIFDGRPSLGHTNEQMELYREGIYFLRGLSMKVFFTPTRSTQDHLLDVTMDIVDNHLALQHKYAIINNTVAAEDFSQLLSETLFGLWIRLETTAQRHWERLATILSVCTDWSYVVSEWAKVVLELTQIMGNTIFCPQTNGDESQASQMTSRKRPLKSGAFEGSNFAFLMNGPLAKALSPELLALVQASVSSASSVPNRPKTPAMPAKPLDAFLNWPELPWTRENVMFLWKNTLRALGDINNIERADIHEAAIQCLAQVYDRLCQLRDAQSYFDRPLPPLFEFAIPLFDACDLPARNYERSRCIAFATICRMFTRRLDLSFPDEFYGRFYLAIIQGLSDKDDPVASVILLNASTVFSRNLPGSHILIAPMLKAIAGLLNSQIPKERSAVLVPIMRLAENIAILPDVYSHLAIPRIEAPLPIMSAIPITCAGEMELDSIKMQVKDLLSMLDYQEYTRSDAPVHGVLLCTIGMLLLNELLAYENPSHGLIDGLLNALLDHLMPKDSPVLPVIFDQLTTMANLLPHYAKHFGQEREVLLMQRIITATRAATLQSESEELTSRLVLLLLDWTMALPSDWLQRHSSLREQVFSVLEECVLGAKPLVKETAHYCLVHLSHHLRNFPPESTASLNSRLPEPDWSEERVLYFALGESSIIAFQQLSISSENPANPSQVRIIIRNAAGRFTWDAGIFFETFDHRVCSLFRPEEKAKWREVGRLRNFLSGAVRALDASQSLPSSPFPSLDNDDNSISTNINDADDIPANAISIYHRSEKQLPVYDAFINLEKTDMLNELLGYLTEEHGEGLDLNNRSSLRDAFEVNPNRREQVDEVARHCREQEAIEASVTLKYSPVTNNSFDAAADDHNNNNGNVLDRDSLDHERISPADRPFGATLPFQACRQLLANLGFLSPVDSAVVGVEECGMTLKVLKKTPAMMRDLRGLDRASTRELVKVALFYVAPGQEDETSILRNVSGSPAYEEFVRSLGWSVPLGEHTGYAGGMEAGSTRDDIITYYCDSLVECVFHDTTALQMTTAEEDEKVLSKKRHVGNDHVYIIWNEHYRDYQPAIMRGDFGNAQIVVTPLANHTYQIQVYRDASVGLFGPLFDGSIVPRSLLGPLIRNTAINAHRAVRHSLADTATMQHPMSQRASDLALIVKRHAQQGWSYEQSLNYLFFANPRSDEVSSTANATANNSINAHAPLAFSASESAVSEVEKMAMLSSEVERLEMD